MLHQFTKFLPILYLILQAYTGRRLSKWSTGMRKGYPNLTCAGDNIVESDTMLFTASSTNVRACTQFFPLYASALTTYSMVQFYCSV